MNLLQSFCSESSDHHRTEHGVFIAMSDLLVSQAAAATDSSGSVATTTSAAAAADGENANPNTEAGSSFLGFYFHCQRCSPFACKSVALLHFAVRYNQSVHAISI
jgi:hypothetical protein